MCTIYLGQGTVYVRLTTHPISVSLDKTPNVSTLCMDARTLSHWTRCPIACRVPLTMRYPELGILDFVSDTYASSSSSVKILKSPLTDGLSSFIRRNSVVRDTPINRAIPGTEYPSSRSWQRRSSDIMSLGRPTLNSTYAASGSCRLHWCSKLCSSVTLSMIS